jgi:hypothetical protein
MNAQQTASQVINENASATDNLRLAKVCGKVVRTAPRNKDDQYNDQVVSIK